MKKLYLIVVLILTVSFITTAQNLIAVQNNGAATYYPTLTLAITNALDGDTIYIPGGNYEAITVNKPLHLVGVGHQPDSTDATGCTHLGILTLTTGADNGSVTGISFKDFYIIFGSDINGYTISRCLIPFFGCPSYGRNFIIKENICGVIAFNVNYTNNSISNNIVLSNINSIYNSIIKNNIVLGAPDDNSISTLSNCLIENNIFCKGGLAYVGTCIFHNNVNAGVNGVSGTNQGSNNFVVGADLAAVFVNYNASMINYPNYYIADLHLVPGSPYVNMGRDGTDIGIYGGAFPWKNGSLPFNPHVQSVTVGSNSDSHGNLNVQMKVTAQDN